jgi:hypothetical protein
MKKRTVILIVLGLLTLVTLGCSVCSSIPGLDIGGGGTGNVTLVNDSGQTICYVYISPTEDEYWGDDWLGSSETVAPGDRRTFDVENGVYDLMVEDCSENQLDVQWEVDIRGSYTWTVR